MTMYLLICGSRHTTPAMLDYTHKTVLRALERGWFILAGDALGVDQQVAESVRDHFTHEDEMMFGLRCYGLAEQPRHGVKFPTMSYVQCKSFNEQSWSSSSNGRYAYGSSVWVEVKTYADRDRYMVRNADAIMCVWNGGSLGTLAAYRYACSLGKPAWLAMPGEAGVGVTRWSGVDVPT